MYEWDDSMCLRAFAKHGIDLNAATTANLGLFRLGPSVIAFMRWRGRRAMTKFGL